MRRTTGVRLPARNRYFSSHRSVLTASEVHPASYPTGSFPARDPKPQVNVKVMLRPTVSRPVWLCDRHPCETQRPIFPLISLIILDSSEFVDVGRPLWREVGSVVLVFAVHRQWSFSQVWVPRDSWAYFIVSISQPGGPGSCIYIPQEQDNPVIPPGNWVCLINLHDISIVHVCTIHISGLF
jgi:hypothetical protein